MSTERAIQGLLKNFAVAIKIERIQRKYRVSCIESNGTVIVESMNVELFAAAMDAFRRLIELQGEPPSEKIRYKSDLYTPYSELWEEPFEGWKFDLTPPIKIGGKWKAEAVELKKYSSIAVVKFRCTGRKKGRVYNLSCDAKLDLGLGTFIDSVTALPPIESEVLSKLVEKIAEATCGPVTHQEKSSGA